MQSRANSPVANYCKTTLGTSGSLDRILSNRRRASSKANAASIYTTFYTLCLEHHAVDKGVWAFRRENNIGVQRESLPRRIRRAEIGIVQCLCANVSTVSAIAPARTEPLSETATSQAFFPPTQPVL